MKLKVRLDQKTIQEFFLQHLEKMVLAIVVLLFLFMVYSALMGVERYRKTPDQLIQSVKEGERTVASTEPTPVTLTDYVSLAQRSREPTPETPYATTATWDPSLFQKKELRPVPPVYTVHQLRGAADKGTLAAAGGPRASSVRGKRWVTVTGLVPLEQQEQAYVDALRTAVSYEPGKDRPAYLGFWVQRAEVKSPAEAANPDWDAAKKILSKTAKEEAERQGLLSATQGEVVGKEYLDEALAFSLPPVVMPDWTEAVAHAPEIPLTTAGEPGGPGGSPQADDKRETKPRPDDPFGVRQPQEPRAPTPETPVRGSVKDNRPPRYLLFRFIDFQVEPGKQYVYRVKLALANPNFRKKESEVKDPKSLTKSFLETKWSDPTAMIAVPRDTRVFALNVKPGRTPADTQATIALAKWLERTGSEKCTDINVARGQLAVPDDRDGGQVRVNSDPIAIDFRGGQKITNGRNALLSAGEVLLLAPDGSLLVRNELEDWPAYDKLVNQKPAETPPGPQPGSPAAPPGVAPGRPGGGALENMEEGPGGRRRPARPPRGA